TEIVSCPGCGRTLYDLQSTTKAIKERFKGRAGLKIAVMGCIVNGPGEMADADYGYVGAGPGLVTLYKDGKVVERNIAQSEALDRLAAIIGE
ncbi:MAG: flavodoxin-dependent (E)-4-hydroxy-3-methylbut-2-enyl-diphosphate synthase, partial [Mucinivorans sp.]